MGTNNITVANAMTSTKFQKAMMATLQDPKRVKAFSNAIITAVAQNPAINLKCTPASTLSCALLGESLNLLHSPQMGHYYMIPFDKKEYNPETRQREVVETTAQFVLGYKGLLQLAKRSGQYKDISVAPVKQGELVKFDPIRGKFEFNPIQDYMQRKLAPTMGYYASFEELNGFTKEIYWSKEEMIVHADTYSPAFNKESLRKLEAGEIPQKDLWKYSSFWYKDFDGMAQKTMLRQLISKWGTMSIEVAGAIESDGKSISENLQPEFEQHEEVEFEDITPPPSQATEVADPETGEIVEIEASAEPEEVNIDEL